LSTSSSGSAPFARPRAHDFHDRDQLQGLDAADAGQPAKVGLVPLDQGRERAGLGDEPLGDADDVVPPAAAAEEHGEQLGVTERGRAESLQAFLRPVGDRKIPDAEGWVGFVAHGPGRFARWPAS
jgi:hypothetical protein